MASKTINAYVKLFSVDVGRGDEPTHLLRLSVKNRNTKLTKQNLSYSSFLWLCLNVLFSALCDYKCNECSCIYMLVIDTARLNSFY